MRGRREGLSATLWRHIKAALTENLGLKAICFVCALLLTAYERSQADEKARTIAFAINAQLPPEGGDRELMTPLPPSIKVTVQGSTRALEELASSSPAIDVDLSEGHVEHIKFTPEQIEVPPGVRVRMIDPGSLNLEWQDIITRNIPIQSSVTGHVADGHEVARLSVQPEYVELHGPSSLVRVTQLARVAPFDITGLSTGEYKRQLALDPAPDRTQYLDVSSATVTVEIRRRQIAINFPKLPVDVVGIPGAKTVPAYVDVTVRGTPDVVKGLQQELVVPRVDASEVDQSKHGSTVLTVSVDLSRASADIQPPTVKVSW